MPEHILIVEDEVSVAEAVAYALAQEGFTTETAPDGSTALDRFEAHPPDLVLLDLMLPGLSGWQLFTAFRKQRDVPVIMFTARVEETDRVAGLEMGADDYITKPFSMRELIARVRAVLRRYARAASADETAPLRVGGLELDPARHEVRLEGRQLELSPREFDLLAYLMRHAGRVRTREEILSAVWGQEEYLDERTVDVHVSWLRKKIETEPATPRRILTLRGLGYKLAES